MPLPDRRHTAELLITEPMEKHMTDDPVPAATMSAFRDRFPALAGLNHLASCSQGALSHEMITALFELQHTMWEAGAPWAAWTAEVERAREGFANFINAAPSEIAVVSCASEGAYHVASSQAWQSRPGILTTDMEFPSIAHVWLAQRPRGADVVHVGNRDGAIETEDYLNRINERTGLVSVPLVSYRNGARPDVSAIIRAARDAGARVFVDGYQGCGVMPVDVRALDCDYFVTGTLKYMLGLPGLAFLYVRRGLEHDGPPQLTGWFGQQDPFSFDPHETAFAPDARRFQTGTPAIPSAYAANAGLRALQTMSPSLLYRHVEELVDEAQQNLLDGGERLWSPQDREHRGPMVAILDSDPDDLAAFLSKRRISTSPRGEVLRLSFHGYNTSADVEAVCSAIRDYRAL